MSYCHKCFDHRVMSFGKDEDIEEGVFQDPQIDGKHYKLCRKHYIQSLSFVICKKRSELVRLEKTLHEMKEGDYGMSYNEHRLRENPDERVFLEEFREYMQGKGAMARLLNRKNVSKRDRHVAETVAQWLGSPVGQGFLDRVNSLSGKMRDV